MTENIPFLVSLSPLPKAVLEMYLAPYLSGMSVNLVSASEQSPEEIKEAISKADILLGDFTFLNGITAETIRPADRLRFIQQPSVGYQHIDIDACRQKGIPVANAAGANSKSVAEHTIMMALVLLKQTFYFHAKTERGEWAQMEAFDRNVCEMAGKKWGIVGMGKIGKELARRLKAFEVEVCYTDMAPLPKEEETAIGARFAPLDKLIRTGDIISLHVPLTEKTQNMINASAIRQMKPGCFLINVARGELVDEKALVEALNSKKLGGAGLDVFAGEPLKPDNPLLKCKNVVLTPHLAGTTFEARKHIVEISITNIVRVLKGEKPINVVNGV